MSLWNERTDDVVQKDVLHFDALMLHPLVRLALESSGYERPSPVQMRAIPVGRMGLDLIAQAKSGTGKTVVFAVCVLDHVLSRKEFTTHKKPLALIISPTREIALQTYSVLQKLTQSIPQINSICLVGGRPVSLDVRSLERGTHIVVGTPGRLNSLLEADALRPESIRLVVFDEADFLFSGLFLSQTQSLLSHLPQRRQSMAVSATFSKPVMDVLNEILNEPTNICLSGSDEKLLGVDEFYVPASNFNTSSLSSISDDESMWKPLPMEASGVSEAQEASLSASMRSFFGKCSTLVQLLLKVSFHQCIVFCNSHARATVLSRFVDEKGGFSAAFVSGKHAQKDRESTMERLRNGSIRVLIATDLLSRGVDLSGVDLVFHMEAPMDFASYRHRCGRAGRFGGRGMSIVIVGDDVEIGVWRSLFGMDKDVKEDGSDDGMRSPRKNNIVMPIRPLPSNPLVSSVLCDADVAMTATQSTAIPLSDLNALADSLREKEQEILMQKTKRLQEMAAENVGSKRMRTAKIDDRGKKTRQRKVSEFESYHQEPREHSGTRVSVPDPLPSFVTTETGISPNLMAAPWCDATGRWRCPCCNGFL